MEFMPEHAPLVAMAFLGTLGLLALLVLFVPVSYTHLTLPTICSV